MARKLWNHTPALPLKTAPYWNWPLAPIRTVGHLMKSWKPYGTRFLFLAIACVLYFWFSPDLEVRKNTIGGLGFGNLNPKYCVDHDCCRRAACGVVGEKAARRRI